jgi:hypothetical protein
LPYPTLRPGRQNHAEIKVRGFSLAWIVMTGLAYVNVRLPTPMKARRAAIGGKEFALKVKQAQCIVRDLEAGDELNIK